MNNNIKVLLSACQAAAPGIKEETEMCAREAEELIKSLKEQYGIEVHIRQDTKPKVAADYRLLERKPALEFCGHVPDGKARRRERRKQERARRKP